jgi:alcohol dehydrogenase, propanol-preferring
MKAMLLKGVSDLRSSDKPLEYSDVPVPEPSEGEILIRVRASGVCHTELDEIEGRTPPPHYPVIPGHQVVGTVEESAEGANKFTTGDRVGVAWIYSSCGVCRYCLEGNENLCPEFMATGRDADGGYAEYMKVSQDYAYKIPDTLGDSDAAPLLCAGAVGYRALRLTGIKDGQSLGLTGFGASGHLVLKTVKHMFPSTSVYVFARSGTEREFAMELGADWAGDAGEYTPEKLDAVIDTTPVWKPVIEALKNLRSGGRLVINAIRKEDVDKDYLLKLKYHEHMWMEKEIKSVANVSPRDVKEFLELAGDIPIKAQVEEFSLEDANTALVELKKGNIKGAKVLKLV